MSPAEPPWVSTIHRYWQAAGQRNRRLAIEHARRAGTQDDPARCLCDLQESLRALRLNEVRIIKLLSDQHLSLVAEDHVRPLRELARQIMGTLESLPRGASRDGCEAAGPRRARSCGRTPA